MEQYIHLSVSDATDSHLFDRNQHFASDKLKALCGQSYAAHRVQTTNQGEPLCRDCVETELS